MPDDAVLVSLIAHSLLGDTAAERQAARLLLDLARNGNGFGDVQDRLSGMSGPAAVDVAEAANRLIARYDLR